MLTSIIYIVGGAAGIALATAFGALLRRGVKSRYGAWVVLGCVAASLACVPIGWQLAAKYGEGWLYLILASPLVALLPMLAYRDETRARRGLPAVATRIPGRLTLMGRGISGLIAGTFATLSGLELMIARYWWGGVFAVAAAIAVVAMLTGEVPHLVRQLLNTPNVANTGGVENRVKP